MQIIEHEENGRANRIAFPLTAEQADQRGNQLFQRFAVREQRRETALLVKTVDGLRQNQGTLRQDALVARHVLRGLNNILYGIRKESQSGLRHEELGIAHVTIPKQLERGNEILGIRCVCRFQTIVDVIENGIQLLLHSGNPFYTTSVTESKDNSRGRKITVSQPNLPKGVISSLLLLLRAPQRLH